MVMDAVTGEVVANTTTDTDGNYEVTGLAPGSYTVTFKDPEERPFTSQNVGDDALDSDANADGTTSTIVLSATEFNPTIDAGVVEPVAESTPPEDPPTLAFTGVNSSTISAGAFLLLLLGFGLAFGNRRRDEGEVVV